MNHAQVIDQETHFYNKFRAEGKRLVHFCNDWDGLAIHSEMDEIAACCCDFELESDNILRDEKASAVNQRHAGLEALKRHDEDMAEEKRLMTSTDFSSVGAPAHSGTEATNLVVSCDQLRTAVAQAREADIDLVTAIWGNLLMDCERVK